MLTTKLIGENLYELKKVKENTWEGVLLDMKKGDMLRVTRKNVGTVSHVRKQVSTARSKHPERAWVVNAFDCEDYCIVTCEA